MELSKKEKFMIFLDALTHSLRFIFIGFLASLAVSGKLKTSDSIIVIIGTCVLVIRFYVFEFKKSEK